MKSLLEILKDKSGCMGGGSKSPSVQAAPPPSAPPPTPSEPMLTEPNRKASLERLRYGLASTIKGGAGITGKAADLMGGDQGKKKTLGS